MHLPQGRSLLIVDYCSVLPPTSTVVRRSDNTAIEESGVRVGSDEAVVVIDRHSGERLLSWHGLDDNAVQD